MLRNIRDRALTYGDGRGLPVMSAPTPVPAAQAPIPRPSVSGFTERVRTTPVTTREVGANETVASQLNNLTAGNSPYIQQARRAAEEFARRRGMSTSSYAAGSAQRAAIEAALPIAQADAATFGRTAADNMDARNTGSMQDTSSYNEMLGREMGANLDLYGLDVQSRERELDRGETREDRALREREAAADREFRRGESGLDRQQQRDILGSQQDFTRTENDRTRAFDREMAAREYRRGIVSNVLAVTLSRPEYMRDPAAVSGLMNFALDEIDRMFPAGWEERGPDPAVPPGGEGP